MKARVLLYQASPLFNTDNNKELWKEAAAASKVIIDNAQRWGYKLSEYANLWGHDTFTNPEFIFVLGTQARNTFEQYNYPVGVENGNSGNCPTQAQMCIRDSLTGDGKVDANDVHAIGYSDIPEYTGSINATLNWKGLDYDDICCCCRILTTRKRQHDMFFIIFFCCFLDKCVSFVFEIMQS